jgi:starch-binding outer membrane protein, SusD/RagB family
MKSKLIKLFLISLLFGFFSCSDLMEEPYSSITSASFWRTEQDIDAALNGIYRLMASHTFIAQADGFLIEFWHMYLEPRTAANQDLKRHNFDFSNLWLNRRWSMRYVVINRCNDVIKNAHKVEGITEEKKNAYIAEARWIRAKMYFDLVQTYGDLPARTDPSESFAQAFVARSPAADIYNDIIIPDLLWAEQHLPLTRPKDGRVKKGAAVFLLGKVYLTMARNPVNDTEKLTLAKEKLLDLINNQGTYGYRLMDRFLDVFPLGISEGAGNPALDRWFDGSKELNDELIFVVQGTRSYPGHGTAIPYTHAPIQSMFTKVGNGGQHTHGYREEFYLMYGPDDERRDISLVYSYRDRRLPTRIIRFGDPAAADATYRSKANGMCQGIYVDPEMNVNLVSEPDLIYYRLADAYLMVAEVENLINNGPNALVFDMLDVIRLRARTTPVDRSAAWTRESMDNYIFDERCMEFVMEFHGRYDILRFNKLEETYQKGQRWSSGQSYDPKMELFPIPSDEMDRNPLAVQNPGW